MPKVAIGPGGIPCVPLEELYNPPMRERDLHKQVAQYLDLALGPGVWWSTFPSDGASRRGRIGLKRGVPDIIIIDRGEAYWIELKTKRGKLSQQQRDCHDAIARARCCIAICRSLDDVEAALRRWGVAMRNGVRIT